MKINALLLGALSVLTAACSSDSPGEPADDALLKSFVLTIGELNYHADIDPDDHTARIGEIQYGGQISGVDYRLAEGATIAPDRCLQRGAFRELHRISFGLCRQMARS